MQLQSVVNMSTTVKLFRAENFLDTQKTRLAKAGNDLEKCARRVGLLTTVRKTVLAAQM